MTTSINPDTDQETGKKVWFEYAITAGRFTAVPVSLEGWLVLLGATMAPLLVIWLVLKLIPHPPVLIALPMLFVTILTMVFGLMKIAIAKGRRKH